MTRIRLSGGPYDSRQTPLSAGLPAMVMDHKAAALAIILVSSTIAGCTGDPDGGGNDEIDSGTLQELFNSTFEDFVNNASIEVTNNYYGDMQTGIGSSGNFSAGLGTMHTVDYEFSFTIDDSSNLPQSVLIYEINIPNGTGIACIERSQTSSDAYPHVFMEVTPSMNTYYNNITWYQVKQIWDMNLDGVMWGCQSGFIGGHGDQVLQMYLLPLNWYYFDANGNQEFIQAGETINLRLLFTFQLIPVIVHS